MINHKTKKKWFEMSKQSSLFLKKKCQNNYHCFWEKKCWNNHHCFWKKKCRNNYHYFWKKKYQNNHHCFSKKICQIAKTMTIHSQNKSFLKRLIQKLVQLIYDYYLFIITIVIKFDEFSNRFSSINLRLILY